MTSCLFGQSVQGIGRSHVKGRVHPSATTRSVGCIDPGVPAMTPNEACQRSARSELMDLSRTFSRGCSVFSNSSIVPSFRLDVPYETAQRREVPGSAMLTARTTEELPRLRKRAFEKQETSSYFVSASSNYSKSSTPSPVRRSCMPWTLGELIPRRSCVHEPDVAWAFGASWD